MKKKLLTLLVSLLGTGSLFAGPIAPPQESSYLPTSDWEYELGLYGWAAGVEGTTGVGRINSNVDVGIDDLLDNLDMAASGFFGVRNGNIGFLADLMYIEVSQSLNNPGPLFSRTDLDLSQFMADLKGSYRVAEWNGGWFEVLAGARYMSFDLDLTLQPGLVPRRVTASGDTGWWDAVGGVRFQHHLTERVFLTGLADAGAGSSDLTWQALAGLGYRFTENVHAIVAYRYLSYDYADGGFTYDVDTQGVAVGLGITW